MDQNVAYTSGANALISEKIGGNPATSMVRESQQLVDCRRRESRPIVPLRFADDLVVREDHAVLADVVGIDANLRTGNNQQIPTTTRPAISFTPTRGQTDNDVSDSSTDRSSRFPPGRC